MACYNNCIDPHLYGCKGGNSPIWPHILVVLWDNKSLGKSASKEYLPEQKWRRGPAAALQVEGTDHLEGSGNLCSSPWWIPCSSIPLAEATRDTARVLILILVT